MRHKDQLKKDILKKRALLEKELQMEVQRELNAERRGTTVAGGALAPTATQSPAKPKGGRAIPASKVAAATIKSPVSRVNNENEALNNASRVAQKVQPFDSDASAVQPTQSDVMDDAATVGADVELSSPVKDALTPANPGKRK